MWRNRPSWSSIVDLAGNNDDESADAENIEMTVDLGEMIDYVISFKLRIYEDV